MAATVQAVRGMNDIFSPSIEQWSALESTIRKVVALYGYQEIRTPIVEDTGLFKRSIGEVTDIVEKEMYTFTDLGGDSLSLRPEGTASCVRAGLQHGLLYNQIQRWWYMGPMFRHERPQKGRYRQFHQFGIEAVGMGAAEIDVEVILLSARLWQMLGIEDAVQLQINSLGTPESRKIHREQLIDYLKEHEAELDEDSKRRLTTNPLRILDSKNPALKEIIAAAPKVVDFLDDASKAHFEQVQSLLKAMNISFTVNPCLVRGLDYYTHTVFEWVTEHLGAQATVCAGGRYDGLVSQLGGQATPAVGFALGLERLLLLLEKWECDIAIREPKVYVIGIGEGASSASFALAETLRERLIGVRVLQDCVGGNPKKQFKRADKNGADIVLVLGDEEIKNNVVTVKYLREDKAQNQVTVDDLIALLQSYFK